MDLGEPTGRKPYLFDTFKLCLVSTSLLAFSPELIEASVSFSNRSNTNLF